MKPLEKQKMCPSCEGRVPLEAEVCPFCAHELSASKPQSPLFQSQSLEESLSSLYKPPYQSKPIEEHPLPPKSVEASLYGQTEEQEEPREAKKSSVLPTLLLMCASQLFLLGLLQLFFASGGTVHLEWDAGNWFYYCLISAPLFYFGWKKLQEID